MELKANLHMHTSDDPLDPVEYSLFEVVDHAAQYGFDVLALTCHRVFCWKKEYADYASSRGIILIRGIEISIDERPNRWGKHVLILGATKDAEQIRTFSDLAEYKKQNSNAVIVAPHPYFYGNFSLHHQLENHINLFDAIEHSWFYSQICNRNKKATRLARRYNLPLIATSDTHFLNFIDKNYCLLDAQYKTENAVLHAIQAGAVKNITSPRRLFREMLIPQGKFFLKTAHKRLFVSKKKRGANPWFHL